MKFLHTSDWHLGMIYKGGFSYRKDQEFVIDEICRIAVNEKVDGIFIAGDIFDKSISSQEALQLYDYAMTRLCIEHNIPVFIIAGNHDGAERLAQCNKILEKSGLYIVGSLQKDIQVINMGDVDIYMLPWISTEKVKTVYPDIAEDINSIEDAYRLVLNKYRDSFVKGHKNILLSHAFIVNAETSVSDRAAEVGLATMVGSSVFEGFDYVALGHLHGPQIINEHIRYSGTPMAYSFGKEENQKKGVVIINTDSMEQSIIPLPQLHRRITLTGTYDELINGDYEEDILNGYVKLVVTDCYIGMDELSVFKEKYRNLLEVSGKSFEREDAKITLTLEEFNDVHDSPQTIFKKYCEDMMEMIPGEHLMELFENALIDYEKEIVEE